MSSQPCVSCGEETAAGSVFYSDRHTLEVSGNTRYLCALCDARIRASRKGQPMTDEEVQSFVENGSMAMLAWARF